MLKTPIWKKFLDGTPEYLARHYWWAYLWRPAIWFFDRQPIINLILFGQYKRLLKQTLHCLEKCPAGNVLQLTSVYGKLTPALLEHLDKRPLHLIDIAEAQLQASIKKLPDNKRNQLICARMNAESLAFKNNSFNTILIFFLMHEMPAAARLRTLSETIRIMQPGARLVITEYAEEPINHWIYRRRLLRNLLTYWEPFLQGFWREDFTSLLHKEANKQGKKIQLTESHYIFNHFYRVLVYQVDA